jgi:hypothetical protein
MGKLWINAELNPPPQKKVVETCIQARSGEERNVQLLQLDGRLWWHADHSMYVYYTPTHWRHKS